MNKLKRIITTLMILSVTAACENGQNGGNIFTKENIGALTGAAGGAWVGSNVGKGKGKIVGIAAGTLLGGMLGKSVGASLDKADMGYYNQSSQRTLETAPTGQTSSWRNPDSGNSGTITPTRTYQENGSYCREYNQTVNVGGEVKRAYGTACRQPDGSWQIKQ